MSAALQRGLAQALLPASILPVLVFGPGLIRAPQRLWQKASAEVRRLEAPVRARGARRHGPGPGKTVVRREERLFPGARYSTLRAEPSGLRRAASGISSRAPRRLAPPAGRRYSPPAGRRLSARSGGVRR
jgi:hypothetical protein